MNKIVFREVVAGKRLTYDHSDEGGADLPPPLHVTDTFAEHDRRTLPVLHSQFDTPDECAATKKYGAIEGGRQTLARLEEYVRQESAKK